ncbi:unnamed protein product [Meganyctiphanes norvegica]|uniref:G-protein coupled receptors family 1 profile domain-containing protein n=1 Tax=Meganyctiphanes norvegica TaxID=48144 RepID=A0AAV2QZ45_MEGNR
MSTPENIASLEMMSTTESIPDLVEMLMEASSSQSSVPREPHFAPWAILFSGVAAVVIATLGFFGNLLTILALPYARRLRNAATWMVLNLAVAEGLFCVTILPMCAAHLFHLYQTGQPLFNDEGCRAFVFLRYVNIYVELFSIAAIAVNRCVLIANPRLYQKTFTDKKTIGIIAVIWLVPIFMMTIPLTGTYGEFGYNHLTEECDFMQDPERFGKGPQRFFLVSGFFIPNIIIVSSYSFLFYKARKSSARMTIRRKSNQQDSLSPEQPQQQTRPGLSRRDIRIARTIGVIFIGYLVCCTPVAFMHYYDKEVMYPNLLLLLHPLYWLQYCLNIFIYVFMNKQYRDAYINYIASWWPDFKVMSIKKFQWAEEVSEFSASTRKKSLASRGLFKITTRKGSSSMPLSSPTSTRLNEDQQL